jgi:hypothetical protein
MFREKRPEELALIIDWPPSLLFLFNLGDLDFSMAVPLLLGLTLVLLSDSEAPFLAANLLALNIICW